ncbi:expressed unknown protein [Seminavis robusta]|uniref:Uncharacterized protein n=1 Tax=Seminavis robusta TaxID=568900 RepID=A0A9N8EVY0_9STRA|nr:expressed unknown protein [Seminavis robusta]|eukprot:Sro2155_g316860.1 n/a (2139) ;mRNA; f:1521-8582
MSSSSGKNDWNKSKRSFATKSSRRFYTQVSTTDNIEATTQAKKQEARRKGARCSDKSFCRMKESAPATKQEMNSHNGKFVTHNEVRDSLGRAWRAVLVQLVAVSFDETNALRLTRFLQLFLPFLTGHEAFALGQVIEAMDKGKTKDIKDVLKQAFQNRNVSRILVQSLRLRYDFLWHWSTMITWNRLFDSWGLVPVLGITRFPATENFPATRNHALASMFRLLLGPGNWPTRVVTQGREGLITDNPNNTAQNLAAESNGFELANRNQFGTYFGRRKLNEFRFSHRLPTDESIVRTFVAQPMPTMVNNGVFHVIRQLANHWNNMLMQPCGNFSHQRMEQLDPFETLRFHIPEVLLVLASLRGRNEWDSRVMGPLIKNLQALKPSSTANNARKLARTLGKTIIGPVCAGIPSLINPFRSWVHDIEIACDRIDEEALAVYKLVSGVEEGIDLGYELFTKVSWKVPSDGQLRKLILDHIDGKYQSKRTSQRVRSALQLTTPRDKRTLIELVQKNLAETKPAKLLLGRVKTLLQRELRRDLLNKTIHQMSKGQMVAHPVNGKWYWLESTESNEEGVYVFDKAGSSSAVFRFVNIRYGRERFVSRLNSTVQMRKYVAVGEAISRAQKAFMTIELEFGNRFTYNAFMELSFLRTLLRRLLVVSQLTCEELDAARVNVLKDMQNRTETRVNPCDLVAGSTYYAFNPRTRTYVRFVHHTTRSNAKDLNLAELARQTIVRLPPQNMTIIGGGPTGLMTAIHCAENVLLSGGTVQLYEARDSFAKGGSSFERAQIVRLDARWIAMLRYHLGTGFEDVFIPASGETDSQLGNTLPTQGFVEITIKDLESLLHSEVSRLWSKGIISVHADSKAKFDSDSNRLTKLGKHLKVNDIILRNVDENGVPCRREVRWKVVHLIYSQPLGLDDLRIDKEYGVYVRQENTVLPFKLVHVCLESKMYKFESLMDGKRLEVDPRNLPSIYPKDTEMHADVYAIALECSVIGKEGFKARQELLMKTISDRKFTLDVGNTHVIEAIGKSHESKVHLRATTPEPYGVLCMQGLKISMGMHNFGEKRWGSGVLDDIRSQNDQNTRIVGDFTKMVRLQPILEKMHDLVSSDENWKVQFEKILTPSLLKGGKLKAAIATIERACKWQAQNALKVRRQTLQCRFFETGDQFYLGMEFPREYDDWKNKLAKHVASLAKPGGTMDNPNRMEGQLMHYIDRLWYEACLETIRTGDVYNPGARHRVPRLYLINSHFDVDLGSLDESESFRLCENTDDRFEILIKKSSEIIVRNVQGRVSVVAPNVKVRREGNLTRTPDGNAESKVALATFPVSHYVNYRTLRVNEAHQDYVFAFIGDEQATPHFMRYSGLTGACINAMLLNDFIQQAIDGAPFLERYASYSSQTNWSSGEVVTRGSGACFGEDGFLRPGFSYPDLVDYLYARVIEHRESSQDLKSLLTNEWTVKLAASLIPRGMELNEDFILSLRLHLRHAIFNRVFGQVRGDWQVGRGTLECALQQARKNKGDRQAEIMEWDGVLDPLQVSPELKKHLQDFHIPMAKSLEQACSHVIRHASSAYVYNKRVSSELYNQPKPVDSVFDDFAVEAQNFANSFVMSVALSSAALAFRLIGSDAFNILSAIVSVLNIMISFDTMTNVARYKIRNEEARILVFEKKLKDIKKALSGAFAKNDRNSIPGYLNPFVSEVEDLVNRFQKSARYYGSKESAQLTRAFQRWKDNFDDPKEIRRFQKLLVSDLIVDTYHVNSYLQEDLVNIHRSLEEALSFLKPAKKGFNHDLAQETFLRLCSFTPVLNQSLQRGSIRWGFIKQRKVAHWNVVVTLRYLYSLLCRLLRINGRFAPIERSTKAILDQVQSLSANCDDLILRREVRDLKELFWATHESDVASMIFVSSSLVFAASIVFTAARIFSIEILERAAFWALVPSTGGALLAIFHFLRKLRILWNLWWTLRSKACNADVKPDDRKNIRMVASLTLTQLLLTLMRLGAAVAASVALPFSIAESGFGDRIDTPMMLPFWIALGALALAILATVFFLIVEYVVRYSLSPKFPVIIVESFRDEINALYWVFRRPWNDVDTKQVQETVAWEYAAREFLHIYRFDTVFAADRFGAILQYIQCGMETEQGYDDYDGVEEEAPEEIL